MIRPAQVLTCLFAVALSMSSGATAYAQDRVNPVFTLKRTDQVLATARQAARMKERESLLALHDTTRRTGHQVMLWEAEIDRTSADIELVRRATDQLKADFHRLLKENREDDSRHGLVGMFAGLALNTLGPLVGVDAVLNIAVSTGVRTAIETGSFEEAVTAMGVAAGAAFVGEAVLDALSHEAPETARTLSTLARDLSGLTLTEAVNAIVLGGQRRFQELRPGLDFIGTTLSAVEDLSKDGSEDSAALAQLRPAREDGREREALAMRVGGERPRHDTRPLITSRSFFEISTAAKDVVRETRRGYWSRYRYEYGVAVRAVLGQQANLDRLLGILDEDIERYESLADEYNRIRLTLSSEKAGVFGQVIKLVAGTLGSALGGPVLGACVSGAIGAAMNGGDATEVLVSAAWNAGYAGAQVAISHSVRALLDRPDDSFAEPANQRRIRLADERRSSPLKGVTAPTPSPSPAVGSLPPTGPSIEANDAIHGGAYEVLLQSQERAHLAILDPPIEPVYPELWLLGGVGSRLASKHWKDILWITLCGVTLSRPPDPSRALPPVRTTEITRLLKPGKCKK